MTTPEKWQFRIDRGGTFTDMVAWALVAGGRALKLLSEDPEHYEDAVIEGSRRALGLAPSEAIPGRRP